MIFIRVVWVGSLTIIDERFRGNLNRDNNILEQSGMSEEVKEETTKEIKPNIKKEHTYTYWVDEKNKSRELPEEHKPKKIEPHLHVSETYIHCK